MRVIRQKYLYLCLWLRKQTSPNILKNFQISAYLISSISEEFTNLATVDMLKYIYKTSKNAIKPLKPAHTSARKCGNLVSPAMHLLCSVIWCKLFYCSINQRGKKLEFILVAIFSGRESSIWYFYVCSLCYFICVKYFSDLQHLLANQQVESWLKKPSNLCPQLCKKRVLGKSSCSTVPYWGDVFRGTAEIFLE